MTSGLYLNMRAKYKMGMETEQVWKAGYQIQLKGGLYQKNELEWTVKGAETREQRH